MAVLAASGGYSGLPPRPSSALSASGGSSSALQSGEEDGPLWATMKRQLYRSEVTHVKRMVGEGLIRQNRLLWDEAASLRQMLSDLVQKNEELTENLERQVKFCGSQHRDLLRRQSQIMLESLKPRVEACGSCLEDFLPELREPKFRAFLCPEDASLGRGCGAIGKGEAWSRPSTPSTRSPSSSRCSTPDLSSGGRSSLVLGRALGLDELAQVADNIREALVDEQEALKAAVAETLGYLEAEAEQRGAMGRQLRGEGEPSTAELQQLTHKLQDLAKSPSLQTLAIMTGPSSPTRSGSKGTASFGMQASAGPALAPLPGGASVQRLRALIAQRRRESAASPPALCAVPELPDSSAAPVSPGGKEVHSKEPSPAKESSPHAEPSKSFDPFFDDPFA
eukprot:TRINITY_DN93393_c0_g1_i1.p1 TRINITY_DN93393_c0_g1~~TRINITY_DN93393_c0_g1_i1.p1  ORF type:complete len:394 (+),score=78.26 TRINITY_DN93393_c0_g1_i1:105-1286(+)